LRNRGTALTLTPSRGLSWALPRPSLRASGTLGWLVTAVVAFLVLVPVSMLVLGSFSGARIPSDFSFATVTVQNYLSVYTSPVTYRVMGNTAIYTMATLALGLTLSFLFAWLVTRTNMPCKWLAYAGLPLALIIPGMLESMIWVLLFSPRIGYVNRFLMEGLGLSGAPFNVYSLAGMIALEGLRMVPTGFLLLTPLLLRFDPSVEEAAAMSGAPRHLVTWRVTLPLLLPGLLSIALYLGVTVLSSFEVPGILGLPGRVYVFSTLIYTYTSAAASSGGNSYGAAAALSIVYLLINVVGLAIYARVTRDSARFAVVTGKAYRPRMLDIGRWRWPALAAVALHLCITIGLPLLVLLWTSITPRILQPGAAALRQVTSASWQQLLTDSEVLLTVRNTLVVLLVTATSAAFFSLLIGWLTTRGAFGGRRLLDQLTFVSHGLPGVILALAMIWFWVRLDAVPVYGTLAIVVIGLLTGFLAYGTRSMSAAFLQVHRELEDAAYTSGASILKTVRRVVAPLLLPALASLWIWVAIQSVRFVTLPLMLQTGPENTVLSSYLWRRWEAGDTSQVAAVGMAMVLVMGLITVAVTRVGLLARRASLDASG
jgi:iron(III) transport system permease protein